LWNTYFHAVRGKGIYKIEKALTKERFNTRLGLWDNICFLPSLANDGAVCCSQYDTLGKSLSASHIPGNSDSGIGSSLDNPGSPKI
jgi:hypothetical protein